MTVKDVIQNAKLEIEKITGAKVISINIKKSISKKDLDFLIEKVCFVYRLPAHLIFKKIRIHDIIKPRQMLTYFLMEKFGLSDAEAAKIIGQDRTTCIHSKDTIKDLLHVFDEDTLAKYELINSYLNEIH